MWGAHGHHALYQEGSHLHLPGLGASGQDRRTIIPIDAQHSQALQEQLTRVAQDAFLIGLSTIIVTVGHSLMLLNHICLLQSKDDSDPSAVLA